MKYLRVVSQNIIDDGLYVESPAVIVFNNNAVFVDPIFKYNGSGYKYKISQDMCQAELVETLENDIYIPIVSSDNYSFLTKDKYQLVFKK